MESSLVAVVAVASSYYFEMESLVVVVVASSYLDVVVVVASYFVEIEGRRDTCSYFMDGNIYRAYENSFSLENYYNYKNQLNKSENCE